MEFPENSIVDILTAEEVEPDWLIPGMFLQGGFYSLVGESGAGKSYVSYTMALAIAAGVPALNGIVPKGKPLRVLYFDDENSVQDRDKYLRQSWLGLKVQHGKEPDLGRLLENFWPLSFQLGHDEWAETVTAWIERVRPHVLVFDTANACFNIVDENNNAEAGQAIKMVKRLMREITPTVSAIILKHAKTRTEKGQVRTVRGAKIWKDQSDGMLFQIKGGGRPRKDGLSLTRLIPDKKRAYGLDRAVYITPRWTDQRRSGLVLEGSYTGSKDHRQHERNDEPEL